MSKKSYPLFLYTIKPQLGLILMLALSIWGVALGLYLSCGNAQAAPLTQTAIVKVATQVRASDTPPKVIKLAANQVFLFRGHSVRTGDSLQVIFEKGGDSFSTTVAVAGATFELVGLPEVPLKGPATVTISGKGLVSYEIQTL